MENELFTENRKLIKEAIDYSSQNIDNFEFYLITDNPNEVEALSGVVYPQELQDIENGFSKSSRYYKGYSKIQEFLGDIFLNKFTSSRTKLVYSTAQIGKSQNRRFLIPQICELNGFVNVTCDAYTLGIMQNKIHYFALLENHFPVAPFVHFSNERNTDWKDWEEIVVKPALECAAKGVKKLKKKKISEISSICHDMQKNFNQQILLQEYIEGLEVSVTVIKVKNKYIGLPPVWVKFEGDILTEKKVDDVRYELIPLPNINCPMTFNITKLINIATEIAAFLGAKGITRYDFRIKNSDEFYLFDLAALPVLAKTASSLIAFDYLFENTTDDPYLFKALIGTFLIEIDQFAQ